MLDNDTLLDALTRGQSTMMMDMMKFCLKIIGPLKLYSLSEHGLQAITFTRNNKRERASVCVREKGGTVTQVLNKHKHPPKHFIKIRRLLAVNTTKKT